MDGGVSISDAVLLQKNAPMPVGPQSHLKQGNAIKWQPIFFTSIGILPALWAASTQNSALLSCAILPTSSRGIIAPVLNSAWLMVTILAPLIDFSSSPRSK